MLAPKNGDGECKREKKKKEIQQHTSDKLIPIDQSELVVTLIIRVGTTRSTLIQLRRDRRSHLINLVLLFLKVFGGSIFGLVIDPGESLLDGVGESLLVILGQLATKALRVGDLALERVNVVLKGVASLDLLANGLVFVGVLGTLLDHPLNLLGGQAALVADDNRHRLGRLLVDSSNLEHTVGINLEGDLDLGNSARCRRNVGKVKLAQMVVVLGHTTFTLEDLDKNSVLVIGGSGEDLALASGDKGVALDDGRHDTTGGLDTESERVNIEKDEVAVLRIELVGQNAGLDSSAHRNSLVRVDILADSLSEVLLEHALDLGDTSGTTDKDNVIDFGLLDTSILENLLKGLDGLLEEVHVELLELGTSQDLSKVFAIVEGLDLNPGGPLGRQNAFRLLNLALELTHGLGVGGDIDTIGFLIALDEVLDNTAVEIFTTEMGVTGSGKDLEDTLTKVEDGDIKGTTTKIIDKNLAILLLSLVKAIGQSGGGGLVHDTKHLEASNFAGVLGSSSLSIVEVRRHSDNGLGDGLTKVVLGDLLHPGEDDGGDLLGGEKLLFTVKTLAKAMLTMEKRK